MNKFLDDPRFAGIKPFEKKFGDGCIIGLKSRKRPRRLAFLDVQSFEKPRENFLNRSKEAMNDSGRLLDCSRIDPFPRVKFE